MKPTFSGSLLPAAPPSRFANTARFFISYDLLSWTPANTHTTASLRADVFFGGRLVVTGEAGTVLFSDDLSNYYLLNLGTTDWLEGVAASSNLVVAVGDNGAIYTSTNAVSWQRTSVSFTNTWLNGVAFGGTNVFVAVGENGFIATSRNGLAWTSVKSGVTANLDAVAWVGNEFLAVGDGGTALASATGGSWSPVVTGVAGTTNNLYAVAGVTNSHLMAGDSELLLQNPTTWLNQLLASASVGSPAPQWSYYTAAWLTNGYLVAGASGMMPSSSTTNGANFWNLPTNSIRQWLWQVARTSDHYVAVGQDGVILSSPNGIDWTLELVSTDSVTNSVLLGIGGSTNLLLAVGSGGTVLAGTNVFFWNLLPAPATNDLAGVLYDGYQFILSGDNGTILTSPNGTNWTKRATPATAFVTSLAQSPSGLVAVGDNGSILRSTDGVSWAMQQITTNWLSQVRYLNGILIAVGNNGTILTCADGQNWAVQSSGVTPWLNAVDFIGGYWVVAGNAGTILASPDSTNWASLRTPDS
jgi:hypothetical protein